MSDASPQPVHVGEVLRGLRAADHNAFYETWKKVNQLPPKSPRAGGGVHANRLLVTVFNGETAIDENFPVLKLTGPVFNTDDRESVLHQPIAFTTATPESDTTESEIAIVQGPLGADGRGQAVIMGYTWVKVHWTDEAHTHAAVESGQNTRLKSASSGIRVLWHEEIPDDEYLPADLWAVVYLGGGGGGTDGDVFCVVRSTIGIRTGPTPTDWGVGAVDIYDDNDNLIEADVTIYNRSGDSFATTRPLWGRYQDRDGETVLVVKSPFCAGITLPSDE